MVEIISLTFWALGMNGMGLLISALRSRPEQRENLGLNPRKAIPSCIQIPGSPSSWDTYGHSHMQVAYSSRL
ncbi:hypothetical protein CCUS01_00695 [Colletotrichum cuscutae]|uniref:Uncharacterized protein n=1 Tax=Colletotrichum cuscutae TaxID=1209917 RepID=A0AAI9Y6T2_9PEZI|nr:hypothetical protein CCUS01_00695 [Colletotrichum cuscutae]